ncbi:ribonuclease Oy-like [Mizuhopecten yessoensis]|uniref:ribonuclease Oy-like n=1 Tax=Mizuhopecten yessoensis TaxID=6573 RepID=UPI000B45DF13|nr:ribonuclease Oy-like [Mizuhopecten yessoensis]XP_021363789.1 ribonuclease Oy-like [Mizuhopecten yessoensis]
MQILTVSLLLCLSIVESSNHHYYEGSSSDHDWDIFTFTQEWPVAVCVLGTHEHHRCVIPPDVRTWGIHGLWPTKRGTRGPTSCNSHLHFDFNSIKSLVPMMKVMWPNMYADTSMESFWEHEWTKHGTCASTLPATGSESLYFQKALDIAGTYGASKLLAKENIVPSSSRTYTLEEIETALTHQIGVNAIVECTKDEKTGKMMLYEVEICFDKQFNPVDCYDSNGSNDYHTDCPHSDLEYPPLGTSGFVSPIAG